MPWVMSKVPDTTRLTRVGATYRYNGPRTPIRVLGFDTFPWPTTANLGWQNSRTDRRVYTRDVADPSRLSLTSGRPQRTEGPDLGTSVKLPDEIDAQRAREILEELRRRLGERFRPDLELQYLERLLRRF